MLRRRLALLPATLELTLAMLAICYAFHLLCLPALPNFLPICHLVIVCQDEYPLMICPAVLKCSCHLQLELRKSTANLQLKRAISTGLSEWKSMMGCVGVPLGSLSTSILTW